MKMRWAIPETGPVVTQRHWSDDLGAYCEEPAGQIRRVGVGHPACPSGWPVFRCSECGEEFFADQQGGRG